MGAFRHALKLDPEFWEAHYQVAAIFQARGRFERAIEEYGYAKRLAPAETKIREALADLYFQKGDFSAASHEFSELLSLNSKSETAHFGLAKVLIARRSYLAAVDELRQAIQLDPDVSDGHRVLGEILLLTHQREEVSKNCVGQWNLILSRPLHNEHSLPRCVQRMLMTYSASNFTKQLITGSRVRLG
jgi:tetratricopeptide (TPR) repeat protein